MEEINIKQDKKYDSIKDNYDSRILNGTISMDFDQVSSGPVSMDHD